MEKINPSRVEIQHFYGNAAENPQKDLCCPTTYPTEDIDHIPQDGFPVVSNAWDKLF